ncbi:hypothetical protein KI809_18390 [Geobacter pelophilus]|uniref:Phage protein Gp138 N-terminal domain-containing protein n=1 Tax=Geoanaerobacter pelophilus TaxID=60036 RepID=A0AAW4L664_9BACT|nr:hypothetical protein [Geoanaerobacter pelophilus]MBT0666284.1 hypothetical protein [Geoanaerobacter pelophilus]
MNLAARASRHINRVGREFFNKATGETLLGAPAEGRATYFHLDAEIEPGQVLHDPAELKNYIVADTDIIDGHLSVFAFHALNSCNIVRPIGIKNDFGLNEYQPVTVAAAVPVIIAKSQQIVQVPVGTPVEIGDALLVGTVTYNVRSVSRSYDWPGIVNLMITIIN